MADSRTDWISAITSTIAAAISIITIITVYIAARQLLTEHRAYQMGLSQETLGPWHDKVKTKHLLGLQQEICTPTITLPMLLKQDWRPNFVFPSGTHLATPRGHLDPEKAMAKASWVNFVEALGLQPQDNKLYHMSAQSTLVNGIVPMRWAGKDLVGVCAMLGFQSFEQRPSFKEPMKLPMQWSGPLGWLQFREGLNGCVVEFRRRAIIANQLPSELHQFYNTQPWTTESHCLMARLWRSANGFVIMERKALYLGGFDSRATQRVKKRTLAEVENNTEEFDDLMTKLQEGPKVKPKKTTVSPAVEVGSTPLPLSLPELDRMKRENDTLFDELMQTSSQEEAMQTLRDPNRAKSKSQTDPDFSIEGPLKDLLQRMREKELGKMEVLTPQEGLLSVVVQGELANSRGLDPESCHEYGRAYLEYSEVDRETFPYRLGDLFMGEGLLKYMKEAMQLLKPDGFYFTPTKWLISDVNEVYTHVEALCDDQEKEDGIFPNDPNPSEWPDWQKDDEILRHAMILCNKFQHVRTHSHAYFTVEDMVAVAKASQSLQKTPDLSWAMLVSPDLFNDLARAFGDPKKWDLLRATVICRDHVLDCTDLMKRCGIGRKKGAKYATMADNPTPAITDSAAEIMDYEVPLCPDNQFSGRQVLASFLDVMVTYFWKEKSWITDVQFYDHVIPQTITMC
ncbi:hypothetical protein F4803DRAFT_19308 [Xylaria telfairii]|nr:hypothetical protein F4803DRAFT_19308 [Xylaria telfairii]